tara:strand:- start:350 stop:460 length:111 start_codon:yes stop_codon:yes gene_type:complete
MTVSFDEPWIPSFDGMTVKAGMAVNGGVTVKDGGDL